MSAPLVVISSEELAAIVRREVAAALQAHAAAPDPLITISEAARRLSCSTRTIRRRVKDGSLHAVGSGRSLRIDPRSLVPDEAEVIRDAARIVAQARA